MTATSAAGSCRPPALTVAGAVSWKKGKVNFWTCGA